MSDGTFLEDRAKGTIWHKHGGRGHAHCPRISDITVGGMEFVLLPN